jgi:hypothetical protein
VERGDIGVEEFHVQFEVDNVNDDATIEDKGELLKSSPAAWWIPIPEL